MTDKHSIFSPAELIDKFGQCDEEISFVKEARSISTKILSGDDQRIPIIVGPCSIHNTGSALDYAKRLKALSVEVEDSFFLVMRVYIEKPRTSVGWKGLVYDPFINGSNDMEEGLTSARKVLLDIAKLCVPCALEFVDPLVAPYIEDLVTWGFIGARTSSSQPHRQLVSGLDMPVGFKNATDGNLNVAIQSIIASKTGHSYLGIDPMGHIASYHSAGNPHSHLVLRGCDTHTNYDRDSIQNAWDVQSNMGIHSRIMVDCSHGNSRKNHEKQIEVFKNLIEQQNPHLLGIMLESFIEEGKQPLELDEISLDPSVSITDSCLDWKRTKELIQWAHKKLLVTV